MATTIHQQLKSLYAADAADQEVAVGGYRIDAVAEGRLIEIQCASLSAIRNKVRRLVKSHDVVVVKPLYARKLIRKRTRKGGRIASQRYSPTRQTFHDAALELVHFTGVFPHPRLTIELLLVEVEEIRLPPLSRQRTRRQYRVEDRRLVQVLDRLTLNAGSDLRRLLPDQLPDPFSTADIADLAGIPRWQAQKLGYCLRKCDAVTTAGKCGNSILYRLASASEKAA